MQEKLLILRKRHKLTQSVVAEKLGISVQQYRAKEHGKYEFTADEMFALSELFGTNLDNIFMPRGHQNGDIEGVN